MIQIVGCDNCGGENIAIDAISVNVQLCKSHWCEKCHNSNAETKTYFFCCLGCFYQYLTKVVKGDKTFQFERNLDL
jgi:hypothetical protein